MMNKLTSKLLVFFFFTLLVCSCHSQAVYTRYIIKNNTNYIIRILAFYESKQYDEIIISPNDAFSKEAIYVGENSESSIFDKTLNPGLGAIRDSVVVIFDDRKVIVQFCKRGNDLGRCGGLTNGVPIEKNIANIITNSENQISKDVKRKGLKKQTGPFVITFDNSDYERAVEL